MQSRIIGTVFKLFLASLAVGLVLSFLDLTPETLLPRLGGTALWLYGLLVSFLAWAMTYVMLGAAVVVPVWLVLAAARLLRRPRSPDDRGL